MGRGRKAISKKGLAYTQDKLKLAIEEVKKGSTMYAAAKKYKIPQTTLFFKVKGKNIFGKKSGPGTVLSTEEEVQIKNWILECSSIGFPISKQQLLQSVQLFLNQNKRQTIFKKNFPGRKWYKAFMQRHCKDISLRTSQNLTAARAAVTEYHIRNWHAEVRDYLLKNNQIEIMHDPIRIFNMDESAFYLNPKDDYVITKRGDKAVYKRSNNDGKECVTVLIAGNGAGMMPPPMVVHAYKRIPSQLLRDSPSAWGYGISENGWMTGQTFFEYIANVFFKWLLRENIERPIVLFVDGHKSHLTLNLSIFCKEHQIILVALFPNSTHLLQPLDVAVFKPLKVSWKKCVTDWRILNSGKKLGKQHFARILERSITQIDMAAHLRSGFRSCGLFPFDVNAISYHRILKPLENKMSDRTEPSTSATAISIASVPRNDALSKLKNLEEMIEPDVLLQFQQTDVEWKGSVESLHLFKIWKKMFSETDARQQDLIQIDAERKDDLFETENEIELEYPVILNDCNKLLITDLEIKIPTVPPLSIQPELETLSEGTTPLLDTVFVWPTPKAIPKGQTSRPHKKLPAVVTGNEWQKTEKARLEKKETEEKKKLERKIARTEKRKIAEKKAVASASKKLKKKLPVAINSVMAGTKTVEMGSYVIFEYEQEYFPGKVIALKEKEVNVKSMGMSGSDFWKWPEKDDILWYAKDDIVEIIDAPQLINNRGIYSEMKKFRNINK